MHTRDPLQFNRFEIKSNFDSNKTLDLRGPGNPIIQYRESIFMPHVEVSAAIIDTGNAMPSDDGSNASVGMLDSGFGQGSETILFNIEDEKGNKIDLSGENDLRVSSILSNKQSFANQSFILTAVSREVFDNTLLANRCKLNTSYNGNISDMVRQIMKFNLKSPKFISLDVDETLNEYNGRGEDRLPFEMILDLQQLSIPNLQTSKGKTALGNTAGFLFWQTSEGYNFKSLDGMFKTEGKNIKRFIENSRTGEELAEGFDGKIVESNMSKSVNMLNSFITGTYSTQVQVFNEVTKKYDIQNLASKDKGNGVIAGRHIPKINDDFLDDDDNPLPTVVERYRDTVGQSSEGLDTLEEQVDKTEKASYNVKQTIQQSHQNYRQKLATNITICIDVDLSLHAGDLIYCEFPELSTKKTMVGSSTRKSGIYMIADLCHYGDKASAFTGMNLVRDSFGVKPTGD